MDQFPRDGIRQSPKRAVLLRNKGSHGESIVVAGLDDMSMSTRQFRHASCLQAGERRLSSRLAEASR